MGRRDQIWFHLAFSLYRPLDDQGIVRGSDGLISHPIYGLQYVARKLPSHFGGAIQNEFTRREGDALVQARLIDWDNVASKTELGAELNAVHVTLVARRNAFSDGRHIEQDSMGR